MKKATWLVLGVVALAGFAIVSDKAPSGTPVVTIATEDDGTLWVEIRRNGVMTDRFGPFANAAAANAAADNFLAEQGGVAPPAVPPIVPPIPQAPYLRVTGGGVTGEAFASTTGVRWNVRNAAGVAQNGTAANATVGNKAFLTTFNAATPGNPTMTLELRKPNGSIVRARVVKSGPGYAWSTFTPGPAGGVSTSTTRPEWREVSSLRALQGALATLQAL